MNGASIAWVWSTLTCDIGRSRVVLAMATGLLSPGGSSLKRRAGAARRNPAESVRQHDRARADRARPKFPTTPRTSSPAGAAADAAAVQPADRDAAVDVSVRIFIGRIHLHVRSRARDVQPQQRELRAAVRRAGVDDRPRARQPGRGLPAIDLRHLRRQEPAAARDQLLYPAHRLLWPEPRMASRSAMAACSIPLSRAT